MAHLRAQPERAQPEVALKLALFALLSANTVYFLLEGTASKALDASAWLLLLMLFEAETRFAERLSRGHLRLMLRAMRFAAAAGVAAAAIRYVIEGNTLDAANTFLWIAVVIVLETEIRRPDLVQRARTVFSALAFTLYAALGLLVLAWALRGEWFDAYDAALWLAAFAILETNARAAPLAVTATMAR